MTKRAPSGEVTYLNARAVRTSVIIVAAGRGQRLGAELPKQYLPLNGACALRRSIECFLAVPNIDTIRAVIYPGDQALYDQAVKTVADPRLLPPAYGGATRAATTLNGLISLQEDAPDRVLIHDAARPFVTSEVITRVMDALDISDGAFAGLPIVDAVWRTSNNTATQAVARDGLWRAQTPQGFDFQQILAAHQSGRADALDDVAIAQDAGMKVAAVRGSDDNYKITVAADLERALAMLSDEALIQDPQKEVSAD